MNEHPILLADDDETDVLLLQRALKEVGTTNPLRVVTDGQEAVDFLEALRGAAAPADRAPALLILDLKMPRMTGFDVLQWLRNEPGFTCLPAVIYSSSPHQRDVERAFTLGANAFVVKASATSERLEFARFIQGWLRLNYPPLACTEGVRAARAAELPRRGPIAPAA